jgi:hypothetical protein
MAAALWLTASTELVAAVPASLARAAGPSLGLVSFELPLELAPSEYRIGWHARLDGGSSPRVAARVGRRPMASRAVKAVAFRAMLP